MGISYFTAAAKPSQTDRTTQGGKISFGSRFLAHSFKVTVHHSRGGHGGAPHLWQGGEHGVKAIHIVVGRKQREGMREPGASKAGSSSRNISTASQNSATSWEQTIQNTSSRWGAGGEVPGSGPNYSSFGWDPLFSLLYRVHSLEPESQTWLCHQMGTNVPWNP